MGHNYCRTCGNNSGSPGSGTVPDPSRKWWQFWKRIPCASCGGDGYAKPPGWPDRNEMTRMRPAPPPPPCPPRREPTVSGRLSHITTHSECSRPGCNKPRVTFHGICTVTHGYCEEHRCCYLCGLTIADCDCPSGHHTERPEFLHWKKVTRT